MRWALVDADGSVTGVILWDGQTEYTPADGLTVVAVPDDVRAGPGWTYDSTNWIAPPVEDEEGEG
jgi:hypothetical protein